MDTRKRSKTPKVGLYRLTLDGDWLLYDLSQFPRRYLQVYSVLYSFRTLDSEDKDRAEQVQHVYKAFPWRGGYSAVNFYESLRYAIPRNHAPRIISIRYESPGWLDLELCVEVAKQIGVMVGAFVGSGLGLNQLYHTIYKNAQERKLLRLRVRSDHIKVAQQHRRFIDQSSRQLSEGIEFPYLKELNRVTPNRLFSLKIIMSLFRRVRDLGRAQKKGRLLY